MLIYKQCSLVVLFSLDMYQLRRLNVDYFIETVMLKVIVLIWNVIGHFRFSGDSPLNPTTGSWRES